MYWNEIKGADAQLRAFTKASGSGVGSSCSTRE